MRGLLVLIAVGPVVAAPVPKELKKTDDKLAILGKWVIGQASVNGKEVAGYRPDHALVFKADGALVFEYPDGSAPMTAAWVIDSTASPKKLSWRMTGGQTDYPRLYKFDGDRLTVAHGRDGGRPAGLDPGPDVTVIEYKRAESK